MAIYKDINFTFEKDSVEGIPPVEDEDSINQSIINILMTQQQEVPFDPLFGSGIRNLLFEKMNKITEYSLKQEIIFALNNHEPRIEINTITIEPNYDNHEYTITIDYSIIYLNQNVITQVNLKMQGV